MDTAGTLHSLSQLLADAGARNIYMCASHGLFTEKSMELIESSALKKVIVTNSLPLPDVCSSKVEQVSIAPKLAAVILAEHFRSIQAKDESFEEYY